MFEPSEVVDEVAAPRIDRAALTLDVANGLAMPQKELDPKYFYDERGSELFEMITELPEYYPTRAERALLESEIPRIVGTLRPHSLVELGAGGARKTRIILDAMHQIGAERLYVPVDVSRDFLEESAVRLRGIYPELDVVTVVGDFSRDIELPELRSPTLFVFLGSTIGNFEDASAVRILAMISGQMNQEDRFLLGADLRKDVGVIEAAYNDSADVTAEFNLNILHVLNRELDANFDVTRFRHRAIYDRKHHRIEMHLDSVDDQTVFIPDVGNVSFAEGESIRTELSHKYDEAAVSSLFRRSGLQLDEWITGAESMFALALGRVARGSR